MAKISKTNAARLLDAARVKYTLVPYVVDENNLAADHVAEQLGEPIEQVFKTLVTVAPSRRNYVFVVPVNCTLNLKKAARTAQEKSIAMIPQKELLPLTGYIHGGCSPIGMKKAFRTVIDASAEMQETIIFSAGKIGYQVELAPQDLISLTGGKTADITTEV